MTALLICLLGGLGAMAMGVAGHFTERMYTIGTMVTRRDRLQFVANPRLSTRAGQSVRMGRSHPMKRCSPPARAMSPSPGFKYR